MPGLDGRLRDRWEPGDRLGQQRRGLVEQPRIAKRRAAAGVARPKIRHAAPHIRPTVDRAGQIAAGKRHPGQFDRKRGFVRKSDLRFGEQGLGGIQLAGLAQGDGSAGEADGMVGKRPAHASPASFGLRHVAAAVRDPGVVDGQSGIGGKSFLPGFQQGVGLIEAMSLQ